MEDQVAETFIGTVEEVNTGCFADGECYYVVDGKRITAIWGWTQDVVGTVKGVDGFGSMVIGQKVEVFARDLGENKYTLYGNADYYVEVIKK